MPPRHRTVMQKIQACRTEELGGEIFLCEPCQEYRYSYHSCQDRHCPKCGNGKADEWLKMQSALLLPVRYFMLTFTLPDTINAVARSNQAFIYSLFFQTAAAALQKLARDPKFVGGQLGFFGVLQTWARDLAYHPHLHFIVAGGGLSPDGMTWLPVRGKFLVPVKALSKIFRAKFRDALKQQKTELFRQVPPETWKKDWVVDCRPVGSGERALKYLAPYIFRVAISNRRLLRLENGNVTFQFRDGETKRFRTKTVAAEEFIRRFLQHALPHRFIKVRYCGFLSSRHRKRLEKVKELLHVKPVATEPTDAAGTDAPAEHEAKVMRCPKCGGVMKRVGELTPKQIRSP
ncbi:MAG: hypothetical protein DKINENOH_03861 [bacterium]|nr:hypothetical protein [bacterium]